MVSFTFDFDRSDQKYRAGDTVHCKIGIIVHSKFKARSLSIRFKGIAHTEWTKSRTVTSNGKTRTVYDRYTGDEEYFRSYQYMFGNQHSSSEQEVAVGTHNYNVSFLLPPNLPTSTEHAHGHIRYTVKANYDISWGFDKDATAPFYVASTLDLNEFPYLREPLKFTEEKIFGCCCCESDPMQLVNVLPKSGFVPGDTIPITIEIHNNSDVRIDFVRVKLKENLTFYTRSPRTDTKHDTTTLNEHFFQTAVAPFQNKIFQTTFYLDPSFEYKLYEGCGIITCEYYIKSEAEASGCHSNPSNTTKITIGTHGFNDVNMNGTNGFLPVAPVIIAPSAPTIFNPKLPGDGVIVEQPLPSYHEAAPRGPSPIPGASGGIGWHLGLHSPSGAPLASTEKIFLDEDQPPPTFEDIQKHAIFNGEDGKSVESTTVTPSAPGAPSEPTAPPSPPQ